MTLGSLALPPIRGFGELAAAVAANPQAVLLCFFWPGGWGP